MKIKELKEKEPLKVIDAYKHYDDTDSFGLCRVKTKIFTDGVIDDISNEETQKIDGYTIKSDEYDVNTLDTMDLYFKDYSYVITYLVASEWARVGKFKGWFYFVKDVSVYLKDSKDKVALKNAKKVIKEINDHNRSKSYSSISSIIPVGNYFKSFDVKEISKNSYSLKKIKEK